MRKRYWKPEVDFTSSTSVFNGRQQDYSTDWWTRHLKVLKWAWKNGC